MFEIYPVRVGIDVDEVQAELLKGACKFWNATYPDVFGPRGPQGLQPYYFTKYDLSHAMGWESGRDQEYHRAFAASDQFDHLEPVEDSVDAIRYLKGLFELHSLTLRREYARDPTMRWLNKVHPHVYDESRVHILGGFNGTLGQKMPRCRSLGLHIVVEDQVEQAVPLAANGFRVVLLDQLHNRKFKDTEMIKRAKGWHQAVPLIEEMAAQYLASY